MKRSLLLALLLATGCTGYVPPVPWPQPPAPPPPVAPVEPPPAPPPAPPVAPAPTTVEALLSSIVLDQAPPAGGTQIPGGTVRWLLDGWMVSATVKGGKVTGKSVARVESNP